MCCYKQSVQVLDDGFNTADCIVIIQVWKKSQRQIIFIRLQRILKKKNFKHLLGKWCQIKMCVLPLNNMRVRMKLSVRRMTEGLSRLARSVGCRGRSRDKSLNTSDSTRRLFLAASRLMALQRRRKNYLEKSREDFHFFYLNVYIVYEIFKFLFWKSWKIHHLRFTNSSIKYYLMFSACTVSGWPLHPGWK